jgi:hypothetical protein
VLLLADDQKGHANTIHDHIQALRRHSQHRVELFNPRGVRRSRFLDIDAFDVLVIHYSLVLIDESYVSRDLRDAIAAFDGLKVQFLQDEYRWVDALTAEMRRIGINVLFSVVPADKWPLVYGDRLPDTELVGTLTGYVPDRLIGATSPPIEQRAIDVGYRGRSLPFWLGRLAHEKVEIGRTFAARAAGTGLRVDIDWTESARIYGGRWNDFVASCRTMLASESGSSIVDHDGSVERAVRAYISQNPTASFEEVERDVIGVHDDPAMSTASPRIFESAALRTAMVMFRGPYAGVVEPWTHYIPLEKDFSNFDEVVAHIRDTELLGALTNRAYDDLIASGRYSERAFAASFDDVLERRAVARARLGRYPRYRLALEQLSVGRSYRVSALYLLARDVIFGYVGIRETLRRRGLRRLVAGAGRAADTRTSLWADVFRLAALLAIEEGTLDVASEPFSVSARFEADTGRLILTSAAPPTTVSEPAAEAAAALASGRVGEILWNHAAVGQYVTLRVPPLPRRIAFDVGRHDSFGIYRFDALAALARKNPALVASALEPLLSRRPQTATTYRGVPQTDTTDANEVNS